VRAGWTKATIGEICEFRYGHALTAQDRSGTGWPVYGSNGIVGAHDAAITKGPTIVIGRKGSYGEVHYSTISAWPIDTTYFVDETCTSCDIKWLAYRLQALGLTSLNRAAAVPGLNREDAYRLPLLVPPLTEQRRIARVLDAAHALCEKRQRASSLLRDIIGSVFVSMFGDPVTNPREWPSKNLGSLGKLERGISRHRPRNAPELLGGSYPLIQTGDVARSEGLVTQYSSTYSDTGLRQSRLWPAGTLCITIAANIAKTGVLTFDACFPDSVVGFTANPVTTTYVQVWLSFLQSTLERSAPESAQKNINLAILRRLPVPTPPQRRQAVFATAVESIRAAQRLNATSVAQLEALFASLRHRAFNDGL